nr:hypothetical protein [Tanacetum cinerariifolium]
MDEEYVRKLHAELNEDIDWDVAIDHVKLKAKEDPAVQRYIDWDVAIDHVKLKAKKDPAVQRCQATKRKPQTKAQA